MKILCFSLLFLCLQVGAQVNQLTLYFIPSPKGMDWSAPSNVAWSALKNRLTFDKRFIGHVFVEYQCHEEKELVGMVGKRFDYFRQLLIENRGLGILFHSFEGQLENKSEIQEELTDHLKNGRANFVRFLLNDGQCQRISHYLKEYRQKNVGQYYGLANRPLYGEGAGCSAFAASFVEVAGLMEQDLKDAWSLSVNIPLKYAGPPLKEEGVSLVRLMFGASQWARHDEAHRTLAFWSPDRMFEWVKDRVSKAQGEKNFSVMKLENAQGISYDKSYLPAPGGPIWQQHTDPMYHQSLLKK